jgi:hypothetical protein
VIALVLACAVATRVGLVDAGPAATVLRETNGRAGALVLSEESALLSGLHGCIVEVEGTATIAGFAVRRWRIRDAGDGTSGFVGTLAGVPGRTFMRDHTSGATIQLDATTSPDLAGAIGRPVLVLGYVVDAGVVRVVSWRPVVAAAPAASR